MTRGNSSILKVREMERREQGGLKSHIFFRIWKKKKFLQQNSCQTDLQNSILLARLVLLVCVHFLLWGRAETVGRAHRSSPCVAYQRAESQSCLYFQRKAIKSSKHTPFIKVWLKCKPNRVHTFLKSKVCYQWPVFWISQFPCPCCKHSVQGTQSHQR